MRRVDAVTIFLKWWLHKSPREAVDRSGEQGLWSEAGLDAVPCEPQLYPQGLKRAASFRQALCLEQSCWCLLLPTAFSHHLATFAVQHLSLPSLSPRRVAVTTDCQPSLPGARCSSSVCWGTCVSFPPIPLSASPTSSSAFWPYLPDKLLPPGLLASVSFWGSHSKT